MKAGILAALIIGALVVFSACEDRTEDAGRQHGAAETAELRIDTSDIGARYRDIDSLHTQMMAQYDAAGGEMPEPMRRLYGSMNEMHGSASRMHSAMMGTGSMMDHDGPTGRDGMMDRERRRSHDGMMRGGMTPEGMMNLRRTREWDQQMAAMHAQMATYMRSQGYEEMAAIHDEMTGRFQEALDELPDPDSFRDRAGEGDDDVAEGAESPDGQPSGRTIYARECAACHGSDGEGLTGMFPPLSGSEWVTGDPDVPVLILLAGLEGPIQVRGETYEGNMPAFGARLSNAEIAAVTSYIRTAWQNDAPRLQPSQVRETRSEVGSRTEPWTAEELR